MKEKARKKHARPRGGSRNTDTPATVRRPGPDLIAMVWSLGEPVCESEGMELVHVEYQREPGGRVLRIYIDRQGGVALNDCINISRQIGDLLDAGLDSETMEAYRLEVSSPGLERPLGKKIDFDRFKGQTARIRLSQPMDGQRNFTGALLGMQGEMVHLSIGERTVAIPFGEIARARLVNHDGENGC